MKFMLFTVALYGLSIKEIRFYSLSTNRVFFFLENWLSTFVPRKFGVVLFF